MAQRLLRRDLEERHRHMLLLILSSFNGLLHPDLNSVSNSAFFDLLATFFLCKSVSIRSSSSNA